MRKVSTTETTRRCAALIHDTIPLIIKTIGSEMQKRNLSELSSPQFRSLMVIHRHCGVSLSQLAEIRGSTLSSTSKLIDGLVERGLVTRETDRQDRRRLMLALTLTGEAMMQAVNSAATGYLADILSSLSEEDCTTLMTGFEYLRSAISAARATSTSSSE